MTLKLISIILFTLVCSSANGNINQTNKDNISVTQPSVDKTETIISKSVSEEPEEPEEHELIVEAKDIKTKIDDSVVKIKNLKLKKSIASGDNKKVLEIQYQEQALSILELLFDFIDNVLLQQEEGIDNTIYKDAASKYLIIVNDATDEILSTEISKMMRKRADKDKLKGLKLVAFERSNANKLEWVTTIFKKKSRILADMSLLNIKSTAHNKSFEEQIIPFAENLSGQLQLIMSNKTVLNPALPGDQQSSETQLSFLALKTRENAVLETLSAIVVVLDTNKIESTKYRQLLLQTGEVSADLFNPKIIKGLIAKNFNEFSIYIGENIGYFITKIIIFITIIFIFKLLAKFTSYLMIKRFNYRKVETSKLMQEMLLAMSKRGIMILGLLVALSQLGIEITAFLTGLGIVGFIVGFALQDSLANFAAGIMILGYKPYDVDDIIETNGVLGTVSKMNLVSTTILTFNNQTLILPNNKIWGDVIKNITLQRKRRIDLEFHVGFNEDIGRINGIIKEIIESHDEVLVDPPAAIEMDRLSAYSMVFVARPWVEQSNYINIRWELLRAIKEKLDQEGINIPEPVTSIQSQMPI